MSQHDDPAARPAKVHSSGLEAFLWVLWVFEIIGFVYLFGCAVIFQANIPTYATLPGLLLGLGLFIYGVRLSFARSRKGIRRVLLGSSVILGAGFVVFGTCTMMMN